MGLDMYILKVNKKTPIDKPQAVSALWENIRETEVAYWRKANHILNWFQHHITDTGSIDNGVPYPVKKVDLERLVNDCEHALYTRNVTPDMRPIDGFFFGSQNVDDDYWNRTRYTADVARELLENTDWDNDRLLFIISY